MIDYETCPGCQAKLPRVDGPTHRYIGASPSCWAIYSAMLSGAEPPIAPAAANELIVDAYAAQHPGTPSDQSIQSVAIHLLVLYGFFAKGVTPGNALWIRRRALREKRGTRRGRFEWLTPPSFAGSLNVADIANAPNPIARAEQAAHYVEGVWSIWQPTCETIIAGWYDEFVLRD